MAKSEYRNDFDDLYIEFCNNLREAGKATSFCQMIKSASSDLSRITILSKECNIVLGMIKAIKKCIKNNSKNAQQAEETLKLYYAKKDTCSESVPELIVLLNLALTQINHDLDMDFEQLQDFGSNELLFLENLFVQETETSTNLEETLLSNIYKERANYFYNTMDYEACLLEALRGIFYAKIKKINPSENVFPLLLLISTSLMHLNRLKTATNILQFSIQLLRMSSMENTAKSLQTVKLVKLMKEIQTLTKNGVENTEKKLNFKLILEPKRENIPKINEISDVLLGASSSLQLNWQADRGRHVVAKKTILAGATIIIEQPFSWIIHPNESLTFCQNCCHKVKNVVPCKGCSSVVLCSKKCQSAFKDDHRYECKFMEILTSSETLGNMGLLCYRTICKTNFSILETHVREFSRCREKANEVDSEDESIFHKKFVLGLDKLGKLDSRSYASVFAQTPNSDVRQGGDLLKRTFSAIFLTICLRFGGYFQKTDDCHVENENLSETEELIASLLLRHLQSTSCNAYSINNCSGTNPRCIQINEVGGATFPIISTTNHSCNSNIYRFTVGKTCIVKTLREIQPGEEILDSYGPHFASNSIEERICHLNGQYLFSCQCPPCVENWLPYPKLPKVNPSFRCPRCDSQSSANGKDKYICLKCSNAFDTKKQMKMSKELEKQFQEAKEKLLSSKNDGMSVVDYEGVRNTIVRYANTLGKIQKWPSQTLIECQEALKLCWNLENRT